MNSEIPMEPPENRLDPQGLQKVRGPVPVLKRASVAGRGSSSALRVVESLLLYEYHL